MKHIEFIVIGLLLLLGCLVTLIVESTDESLDCPGLVIHCAAGLQRPVEEIAHGFEKETSIPIRLNFGGSGQLYSQLDLVGGDLYFPADMSYIEKGEAEGLVDKAIKVSPLVAELVVAKGNPKGIISLADLKRENIRVVIAERSAAVGLFTHDVLEKAGLLMQIEAGKISKMGTVNEVALQVEIGAADVGIVWNVLESQFESCEFVFVEEFKQQPKYAGIGHIVNGSWPEEADAFITYLMSRDKGAKIFKKYGFDVIDSITSDQ